MAAQCLSVASDYESKKIAYNIRYPGQAPYFDEDGNYLGEEEGEGLTCATFVLDIFTSYGFSLVNEEDWPERDDDQDFHNAILETLWLYRVSLTQIDLVRQNIGCARFRPVEVAGSGLKNPPPANFDEACRLGRCVIDSIKQLQDQHPPKRHLSVLRAGL